jgi:hypothetical protein
MLYSKSALRKEISHTREKVKKIDDVTASNNRLPGFIFGLASTLSGFLSSYRFKQIVDEAIFILWK